MKKLFVLFIGLVLSVALMAQTSGTTYTLPSGVTSYMAFNYATHTATCLTDSINGTASKYWVFAINKSSLYYYTLVCTYDTVKIHNRVLGNHVTVVVSGSIDGTYYTMIDSAQFHPTLANISSQTPAKSIMGDVATGVLWRYIKVTATGLDANKCSVINKLMIKVGIRY